MVNSVADLQQLKGVGAATAKLLQDAGYDSFASIAEAGEDGLKKVRGLHPRGIRSIVEQARNLSAEEQLESPQQQETIDEQLGEVREKIQSLAESARERFQQRLTGKKGKRLSSDLLRIEDTLEQMTGGGKKRRNRAGKALRKAQKRLAGLENASLKKIRKSVKRARKVMQRAV